MRIIKRFTRERRKYRINHEIRAEKIRVVTDDGEMLGVMSVKDAIQAAEDRALDLIEIAPTASPPVCRILDHGKYKYQLKKKESEAKKKQTVVLVKEIKFRPKTDVHDVNFKVKHIKRFLFEGNRVKLTVFFRGRELAFREKGFELLDKVMTLLGDTAKAEGRPRFEGRRLIVTVFPVKETSKKKQKSAAKAGSSDSSGAESGRKVKNM